MHYIPLLVDCTIYRLHSEHSIEKKAHSSIVVTLAGIITDLREVHPLNALLPITVTLLGMLTDDKQEQPLKALSPIEVTPSGMMT